tara:strand:+ start:1196 stop:1450 length:255 start_codon:yes stop_codon:yes gene_type:complete
MAKIVHKIEVRARCPADGFGDIYECEIHTTRLIEVEKIIAVCDKYKLQEIWMEKLAEELRRSLCAKIILRGSHYGRVMTEVVAE